VNLEGKSLGTADSRKNSKDSKDSKGASVSVDASPKSLGERKLDAVKEQRERDRESGTYEKSDAAQAYY